MKKFSIIMLAFILVLSGSLMACSNKKPAYASLLSDNDIEKIEDIIDGIEVPMSFYSFSTYRAFPEEYKQLYSIGIPGIPILIEKIDSAEKLNMETMLLIDGLFELLRADTSDFSFYDIDIKIEDEIEHVGYLKSFLAYSRKQIPKIISSKADIDEKIEKLRTFGILSLPYITDKMINKNEEYAKIYTALGLHLETHEWSELHTTGKDEDWYKSEEFLEGADTFDYKKWHQENEAALNVLNDFINDFV